MVERRKITEEIMTKQSRVGPLKIQKKNAFSVVEYRSKRASSIRIWLMFRFYERS